MRVRYERAIVIALIIAVIIVVGLLLLQERRSNRERLLHYQLQSIRTSINLYKAIEHRNPESLNQLITTQFKFPGDDQERDFMTDPSGGDGELVDPFGNPFSYNPKTSWVKSVTPGYTYW